MTPRVRGFVSRFAPFGLWYLNSLRWLYRLPVTHPIKAGILAAMYRATAPERAAMGQGIETASAGKKPVPAFLQGTIPANMPLLGNVKIAPGYYTPFGALGAGYGQTASEQLLPYVSGPLAALQGISPLTRERVKGPHGEELTPPQIGLNFLAEAAAGPVPGATQATTLLEGGGKPYGNANWITDLAHRLGLSKTPTVKPGTERKPLEILGKMLSPTRVIRPKVGAEGANIKDPLVRQQVKEAMEQAKETQSQATREDPLVRQQIKEAIEAAKAEGR
jgi:hypothetical protein